jgi:hypothetical protein
LRPLLTLSFQQVTQIDVEIRSMDRSLLFYLNDDMARKMDHQITLLLDFLDLSHQKESRFFQGPFPIPPQKLFYLILDIFDKDLLMLNQTMFVQFVVYYACSLDHPYYTQKFLQLLFQTILDAASPISEALNSINYIASFLTRAKFVDAAFVKEALEIFLDCLEKME